MLNNQDTILIITDASVKNNIATSVSHIQKDYNIIDKYIHYTMNVNFTEVELFAIRYRIDQVTKIHNALKLVITDAILAVKRSVLFLGTQVELEYTTFKSQSGHVSKATNSSTSTRQQHVPTADSTLNQPAGSNVFNVQLNYNPNQALDPDS